MKQISQIIFFGVCLIGSLAAQDTQSPPPGAPFGVLQQELILRGLDQHSPEVEREIAERKYARYLEQRFVAKMNRFVMLWRAFVEEYNTKSAFNVKLAAEMTKAFHELESGDGWPKTRR